MYFILFVLFQVANPFSSSTSTLPKFRFTGTVKKIETSHVIEPVKGIRIPVSKVIVQPDQPLNTSVANYIFTMPGGFVDKGIVTRISNYPLPVKGQKYHFVTTRINQENKLLHLRPAVVRGHNLKKSLPLPTYMKNSSGIPLHWALHCLHLYLWQDEPFLDLLVQVLQQIVGEWTDSKESSLEFTFHEAEDEIWGYELTGRELSEIRFIRNDWSWGEQADAITVISYYDEPGYNDDGLIVDADILINYTGSRTQTPDYDWLLTVLMHEIGHLVGLDHTCNLEDDFIDPLLPFCTEDNLDPRITESIMYPFSSVRNNQLSELDKEGRNNLFPLDDERRCYRKNDSNGCSTIVGNHKLPSSVVFLFLMLVVASKRLVFR